MLLKLAFRNLLRQKRRTTLTALSIIVGYALLSLSLGMSEGSYSMMIDGFTSQSTGHIQIHHPEYLEHRSFTKTMRQSDVESSLSGYKYTTRQVSGALAYGHKTVPVSVVGIVPEQESQVTNFSKQIKSGRIFQKPLEMLIGFKVAKRAKVSISDELVLISSGSDGSIANEIFTVVGIIGDRESIHSNTVFLSQHDFSSFYVLENKIHEVALKVADQDSIPKVVKKLQMLPVTSTLAVEPWYEVEKAFFQTMETDKKGNWVTLIIIVIMVAISVLNTVLMSVLERTREFGVLKALGTNPTQLFFLIEFEIMILTLISCLLGLLLISPAHYWFYHVGLQLPEPIEVGGFYFDRLSSELTGYTGLIPMALLMVMTALVSIFPALQAAKANPLSALRSH